MERKRGLYSRKKSILSRHYYCLKIIGQTAFKDPSGNKKSKSAPITSINQSVPALKFMLL